MSAMKQPFRFFDLPKELRLLVYEHLHMPRSVLQQATGCEIESKYMAFTFEALATCKLMRDEVKPFLAKAYKTGNHETTHTFKIVNDDIRPAMKCLWAFMKLMDIFGNDADKEWTEGKRDESLEHVIRFWDAEARVEFKARFIGFASPATQIYKKFDRRLCINAHWSRHHVGAPLFDHIAQRPPVAAIQYFIEVVFNSQPNPNSEVGGAGL